MASKNALKRILNKDIKEIINQKLNNNGIYIVFDEENMLSAKAMIVGPKDSLYESGFLFFNIQFPKNYPYSPPDLSYISRNRVRIHPNLYVGHHSSGFGKVCLSILGTWSGPKWSSIMDITTVLLTIQSLLDDNPLHHEPGQEKNVSAMNDLYNEVIRYESINTLLIKNYIDPPVGFEVFHNDMKNEILRMDHEKLKNELRGIMEENKLSRKALIPIYRIDTELNYDKLYKKYEVFNSDINI
tara:strand:- start:1019 stop:1744 length:726 start_codon:yes stop_codon:yes gene_type:complete